MKLHHAWVLIVGASMVGCGGGGGGSGSVGSTQPPSGGTPPPSGGTPPPADGTPPPGAGASTRTSSAEILFPWRKSTAVASSVIVRGKASDPDGVYAIRVNGVDALLTSTSGSGSASKPTGDSWMQSISGATLMSADGASEIEWSVEVELEPGENDLTVTVEDTTGDVTAAVDEVRIKYAEVPSVFTFDPGDTRLLGWSTALTRLGPVTRLVHFDLSSQEQAVYPELHDVGVASCFRSHTEELLYLTLAADGAWHLRSFNLIARDSRLVAAILPPLLSPGPGFSEGPFLIQLVCSGVHEHAYVLANFAEHGAAVKSRVLRIELSGNASILTETAPDESPPWLARTFALSQQALVAVEDINDVAPPTRIALDDGARTVLAPIDVGALAMAAALEYDRLYVTTFERVEEVRLTDPPSKHNVSVVEASDPLAFSQARSIALDLVNNRVIVGDSDLDVLIAVDLATGARSELLSRGVGVGAPMIAPRRLALDGADTYAYVADDGGNGPEKLVAIDLSTGDRRVIGVIDEHGVNRSISGLALDEANGYAYLARSGSGTMLRVDLATEAVTPITSDGDGLLDAISDLVLDSDNRRLLVADAGTNAIVAVDFVTLQKQVISRAGERGEGEAFHTPVSLTLVGDGTSLYAADQGTNQIVRVDLETGDREVVDISCTLGPPESLRQVLYDDGADELLILSSDGIFAFDLATSSCTSIGPRLYPLRIALTNDRRLLAAGFNVVMQIDRETGDVVIVSK